MKELWILYHHYLGEILYIGGREHGLEVVLDYDNKDVQLFTSYDLRDLIGEENYKEQVQRFKKYHL